MYVRIDCVQASNVCLGPDGRVYLSDLGAAKKLEARLSTGPCDFGSFVRLSTFVGTPAAMAPVRLPQCSVAEHKWLWAWVWCTGAPAPVQSC